MKTFFHKDRGNFTYELAESKYVSDSDIAREKETKTDCGPDTNIKELLLNIPMQARHCSKLLPIGWQFSKNTNRGPHKECQTVVPFKKAQQTVHWHE